MRWKDDNLTSEHEIFADKETIIGITKRKLPLYWKVETYLIMALLITRLLYFKLAVVPTLCPVSPTDKVWSFGMAQKSCGK